MKINLYGFINFCWIPRWGSHTTLCYWFNIGCSFGYALWFTCRICGCWGLCFNFFSRNKLLFWANFYCCGGLWLWFGSIYPTNYDNCLRFEWKFIHLCARSSKFGSLNKKTTYLGHLFLYNFSVLM